MDHTWDYALQKSNQSVDYLAVGLGKLSERLGKAWLSGLVHLREENIPGPDLWSRYTKLREKFLRIENKEIGSAIASTRKLSQNTLSDIANEILGLRSAFFARCFY